MEKEEKKETNQVQQERIDEELGDHSSKSHEANKHHEDHPHEERKEKLEINETSIQPDKHSKKEDPNESAEEVNDVTQQKKRKKKSKLKSSIEGGGEELSEDGHTHSEEEVSSHRSKKMVRFDSKARLEGRTRTKSKIIILEHQKNKLGEIIYKGHPSWVLMQNIQAGIRYSVGKSGQLLEHGFLEQIKSGPHPNLFKSPPVLVFPPEGSQSTPAHKTPSFKFKDYFPIVFRHLREKFKIDPTEYMVSLCHTLDNGQNALLELPTPGKSGSLFFFSQDMKYILKTIPKQEAKLLRNLLPAYYKHVMENENTLLPKFFGLHRVKPHKGRQVRFVVMGNIFATHKKVHERFDLKGSIIGRAVTPQEITSFKENVTYKDIDWRNRNRKLHLGPRRKQFLEQLERDCKLLEKLNVMDYSLLVGIHSMNEDDHTAHHFESIHNIQKDTPNSTSQSVSSSSTLMEKEEILSTPTSPSLGSESSPAIDGKRSSKQGHKRSQSKVQTSFPLPPELKSKMVSIFQQDDGGMRAMDKDGKPLDEFYFIGIIDILMLYSTRKKAEHAYKAVKYNKDEISSINPIAYSKRFCNFITGITE